MNENSSSTDGTVLPSLLDRLHDSPFQISMVFSGGGSGAISNCFRYPGASKTFVEAVVAYSRKAMIDYLGEPTVGSSASLETAKQLSQVAMLRCTRLSDAEAGTFPSVGIALVAALPTSSDRKGEDRIHVSLTDADGTRSWSRTLIKGQFTRASAEKAAEEMLDDALHSLLV